MKEIYSFVVDKKTEKKIPKIKKIDGESVETYESVIETKPVRVVLAKPTSSTMEEAEFFYGQKFNFFINHGFLTRAMLSKKMGDLGGSASKTDVEFLQKHILDNIEASRTIEFYEGAKNLDEEQQKELDKAKEIWAESSHYIQSYEANSRNQYDQTADAKAEQKILEWLILHLSYFEETLDDKKELFPLFVGSNYDEKKNFLSALEEDDDNKSDPQVTKRQSIFENSYTTLARAAGVWYNKMGNDQESIQKALDSIFGDKKNIEKKPKQKTEEKKPARKIAAKKNSSK